ncbi:MAG: hypothetical protein KatS3mg110_2894 [Pirellulaceae bacterium]|nr:MAG: hypothetical protein KatS3mg110_2894 [Pirellulaceae bacterium]
MQTIRLFCCNDRIGPQAIISPIADWKGFLADLTTPWDHTFPLDRSYLDELRFELENYSFPWNVTRGIRAGSQTLTVVEAVGGSLSYYVDESRGYLPVKIVYIPLVVDKAGGKPRLGNRVHVLFSEVGHVKGHGWLPMQWTYVSSNMGAQTCELWQFKVTELTMGRPKPELIQVKIPAGRHLIDQKNATKLRDLVIDQDTFVTARDLPKLLDRYYNPSKYLGSIGPRRRPAVWAWLLWGVCGVVAAVGGTYLYIRRWRSGRR